MYCWYLRTPTCRNDLKIPGRLTVCGEKVDFGRIQAPVFVYASREDHIVPWQAAYASIPLFTGKRSFVLGASGHIAGVINPPAKGKRSHWVNDQLPASAEAWFEGATEQPGSWWPRLERLAQAARPASRSPRPRRRATAGTRSSSRPRAATSRPRPERNFGREIAMTDILALTG